MSVLMPESFSHLTFVIEILYLRKLITITRLGFRYNLRCLLLYVTIQTLNVGSFVFNVASLFGLTMQFDEAHFVKRASSSYFFIFYSKKCSLRMISNWDVRR